MTGVASLRGTLASPPRLLFSVVGLSRGSGGIAELSRQVFKTLLEMHHSRSIRLEVQVLEDAGPRPGDELFEETHLPAVRWYGGNRWRFALRQLMSKPDIQLFDHVGIARLSGLIPAFLRRQYILLIHGVEIWKTTRADYLRTARNATFLIANSEYTAQKARDRCAGLPEIRVCWPGKDAMTPMARDADPAHVGPHAMLIVGRLSSEQRHKGHDQLLEAMPLILRQVPDVQLVIAGEGNDRERLEAKARESGIADSVVFTGWVDEARLSGLYSQCAVFVMPSDGDGFGLVFLEAMMHRMPCVGLRTGSAAEIFEDEKSGILVDRNDRRGMADRLSTLLLDKARRRRMGDAARARYLGRFQGKHYSASLRTVLTDQLNHAQAPIHLAPGGDSSAMPGPGIPG